VSILIFQGALDGGRKVTIRLACIDAPETAQRPYGQAASEALKRLAPVCSQMSLRPQTTDRYGRTVAEVLREGRNVNLELVRMGQAFVYEQYLDQCHGLANMQAQRMAEFQRAGVWSAPGGITRPWDWRAANRDGGKPRQRAGQPQRGVNLGVMSGSGSGSRSTVDQRGASSGGRMYCRNLSWQEAQEYLRRGHTYLDGDGDGEACERNR
jgi:micrococcal nuclease